MRYANALTLPQLAMPTAGYAYAFAISAIAFVISAIAANPVIAVLESLYSFTTGVDAKRKAGDVSVILGLSLDIAFIISQSNILLNDNTQISILQWMA